MGIRQILIMLLTLFVLAGISIADDKQANTGQGDTPAQVCQQAEAVDGKDGVKVAQRGCCSWHNGVCGCSSAGRVICCDGTKSPSCTCNPRSETQEGGSF